VDEVLFPSHLLKCQEDCMCWWPCFLMDGVFTFVVLCIDYY